MRAVVHFSTVTQAGACTLLALLVACGTRTQLSSDPTGTAPGDDDGGTEGGTLDQVDPSCVPTPCSAPCTGELLSASTVVFADVDVQAVSVGADAVFMAGNGVFMAENAGFLMQVSREGAARWTATFAPSAGRPMDLAPVSTRDVHLCRTRDGSFAATVDRFDASGELVAALRRGGYSSCEVQARGDEVFVVTSGDTSSQDGSNPLTVTAYAHGGVVRWYHQVPAAGFGGLVSSLSPGGDLAIGYPAIGESGVVQRITVFRGDGTTSWQTDLGSTPGPVELAEVAYAPGGDLVVMGGLSGTWQVDFGRGVLSGSDGHIFLARYAPDGGLRWARAFALPTWVTLNGHAMTVDPSGHVVIVGLSESSQDLEGTPLDRGQRGVVFVEKLDDCGHHLWSTVADTVADGQPRPIVGVDGAGHVVAITSSGYSEGSEVMFATLGP